MKIVIAGASGLIGQALAAALRERGDQVLRLVRRPAAAADEIQWDPAAGKIDGGRLAGCDAIVNLAGENIAGGRWTARRRERIFRSRVEATRTLVQAIGAMARRPAVLVNASAVGFYGDRGDERLAETSAIGHGFLPEVTLAWETHAEGAKRFGVRTVLARFGVVLATEGGALAKMLPAFRFGLGGPLGNGRQWMSWIALEDAVAALVGAIDRAEWAGAVNVVAPGPVTNAEFTRALGAALRRPAFLPVPAFVLRLLFGQGLADEALLGSTRAEPRVLTAAGFRFRHPELAGALAAILGRKH
jgi:uncharacterized protein (TIGR01777 family)